MIKATFKNIGPIRNAELELGDLTIIAGQNNTGKTYLVYTLYGFLKLIFRMMHGRELMYGGEPHLGRKIKRLADRIQSTGKVSIDIEEYKEIRDWIIQRISSLFSSDYLSVVFSAPSEEFQGAEFSLEMEGGNLEFIEESSPRDSGRKNIIIQLYLENERPTFEVKNPDNVEIPDKIFTHRLYALLRSAIRVDLPKPFILSAERFGISLFYKELDFTKNRLVEELQKLSDEKQFDPFRFLQRQSARYAKPIGDNIDFTRDLSNIQKLESPILANKFRSIDKIMDGYYRDRNDEIRFISKRRKDNRFDIPLHLASSSARGLSDLYFYLKHVAEEGQILIIDEPESHLSPTNQILMARLLVFFVNSGLKVLITTHSDYLIKEINNLIMLNGEFEGKNDFLSRHKKDYTENDYLKPESVKAYACKEGELEACAVDEAGIDMPVFDDAINSINKISNDLYFLKNAGRSLDD